MKLLYSSNLRIAMLISLLSVGISIKSTAQNISYFPFNSVVGIGTNPNKNVWGEMRLFTNSYFTSVTADLSPQFTVANTPRANYYVGGGVKFNVYNVFNNYNPVEGYFMNAGVRARPFDKYKRVQVIFEISPYAVREMDAGLFRTMLGIGYNFSRKK
jgi:hypothetical protein